jgi:adenylylsulfate kinase
MKILIMGLPGSGKTTFASALRLALIDLGHSVEWFNADAVRAEHNDWDFTAAGRTRQAQRMKALSEHASSDFVIADFVAPTAHLRSLYNADFVVWMDTIEFGRFADTNAVFEQPSQVDYRITTFDSATYALVLAQRLSKML